MLGNRGGRGGDWQKPGREAKPGCAEPQVPGGSFSQQVMRNMKGFWAERDIIRFANISERSGVGWGAALKGWRRRARRGVEGAGHEEEVLSPGPARGGESDKAGAVDAERAGRERHLLASLWGGRALLAFFREESGQWLPS